MRLVRDMPGCIGCPLRGDGSQGYTSDELIEGAPVLVIGQNPGEQEEEEGRPFVGKTGETMMRTYFPLAGLERGKVSIANALRCRWQNSNELPPLVTPQQAEKGKQGLVEEALIHCQTMHGRIPNGTRLIVTQGEYSLWAATRERSVTSWRGWLLPFHSTSGGNSTHVSSIWHPNVGDIPVLATVHLAALFRPQQRRGREKEIVNSGLVFATKMDWQKVPRILNREWPLRFKGYRTEPPLIWPTISAFDTEFDPETKELTRYSLFDGMGLPYVIEAKDVGRVVSPAGYVKPTIYMHNVEADILHLERMMGARVHQFQIEDTMLMHSVLWSDLPHDLHYLGSLFARINSWKHLGYLSRDYSAGDAIGTWDVAMALTGEMKADPQSDWIYRNSVFPLTSTIMEAERVGMALDQERVNQAIEHFEGRMAEVTLQAQAYTGWEINLGSPLQVSNWLYEVEKIGTKTKKRRRNG